MLHWRRVASDGCLLRSSGIAADGWEALVSNRLAQLQSVLTSREESSAQQPSVSICDLATNGSRFGAVSAARWSFKSKVAQYIAGDSVFNC